MASAGPGLFVFVFGCLPAFSCNSQPSFYSVFLSSASDVMFTPFAQPTGSVLVCVCVCVIGIRADVAGEYTHFAWGRAVILCLLCHFLPAGVDGASCLLQLCSASPEAVTELGSFFTPVSVSEHFKRNNNVSTQTIKKGLVTSYQSMCLISIDVVFVHFSLCWAAYRTSVSRIRHVVGCLCFLWWLWCNKNLHRSKKKRGGSGLFHTALPGALITAAHISMLLGKTVLCLFLLRKKKPGRSYVQAVRTVKTALRNNLCQCRRINRFFIGHVWADRILTICWSCLTLLDCGFLCEGLSLDFLQVQRMWRYVPVMF